MNKFLLLISVVAIFFASCVQDVTKPDPVVEDGDIVLNEIFSKHPDPTVEGDWVELYNMGEADADISGYLINDAAEPAGGFAIPEGTIILSKGYYVVYQPELSISISSGGEDVSLGTPDATLIDYVFCPPSQADGTSFSKIPDGGDTWLNGTEATPNAPNIGDASIPSIFVDYNVAPAAGEPIELVVDFTTSATVSEVAVFYASGDAPEYNESNKLTGEIGLDTAVVVMTDLNVAGEKVSFFVAVTLDGGDVYYYDKVNKETELATLTADVTLWNAYTPISGSVSAPTLALVYSATPTEGYETVALEYAAEIEITEARIYFAAGDAPEYIKGNKIKGESVDSFAQTGVIIDMSNLDVEDADGNVVGNSSDSGVKISFYVRIALANGFEFYYDKDGNVIPDDGSTDTDDGLSDDFKADPSLWNTFTNKAPVTVSSFTYPATPAATEDINLVLEYASDEEILEVRIYFAAGDAPEYIKGNKIKGENDESFTQTGVTINMKDVDVEDADGNVVGTTSDSGVKISFYARIATETSEYYFVSADGVIMAVDDSPADGAFDSSDAFKGDPSLWVSYTVQ